VFIADEFIDLRVLATDYDNYAIVYFCKDLEINKSYDFVRVLSRQPRLDPSVNVIVQSLVNQHFAKSEMYRVNQSPKRCDSQIAYVETPSIHHFMNAMNLSFNRN